MIESQCQMTKWTFVCCLLWLFILTQTFCSLMMWSSIWFVCNNLSSTWPIILQFWHNNPWLRILVRIDLGACSKRKVTIRQLKIFQTPWNLCFSCICFNFYQQEFIKFWPEEDEPLKVDTGMFKLGFREEEAGSSYTTIDFLLESTQVCITTDDKKCVF